MGFKPPNLDVSATMLVRPASKHEVDWPMLGSLSRPSLSCNSHSSVPPVFNGTLFEDRILSNHNVQDDSTLGISIDGMSQP